MRQSIQPFRILARYKARALLTFSIQQVHELAPDANSISAAQKQAVPSKWQKLAYNEKAIWGYCQGSGKNPYKTAIDTHNLAFTCSCPSRKFPCKHGLALLMLHVQMHNGFNETQELPDFVDQWLNKREARQEKAAAETSKPLDEKAQAKRIEKREQKVKGGIEELQLWLKDVVRNGIMSVPQNLYTFTSNITSRMVDAQAGGLAAELRSIENINFYAEGWEKQLLKKLSRIYTITDLYLRREQLSNNWQSEINALVGWQINKDAVLSQAPVEDEWLVFSHKSDQNDKLTTVKSWLYGIESQRFALVLDFFAGGQVPNDLLSSGQMFKAELCFYPGVGNQRALIKSKQETSIQTNIAPKIETITALYEHYAQLKAQNPLVENSCALVGTVHIAMQGDDLYLVDRSSKAVKLENSQDQLWRLLAVSGGKTFDAFLLNEANRLTIAAISINHQIHCI